VNAKTRMGYAARIAANLAIASCKAYPTKARDAARVRAMRGMTVLVRAGYGYPLFVV